MTTISPRVAGFLRGYHAYKNRYPGDSEVEQLRRLDARILPAFMSTIENPPEAPLTTKLLLVGFIDFVTAMDDRLAELGHPEFNKHDRVIGAKNYFARDGIDIADILTPMAALDNKTPMEVFIEVRSRLWKLITAPSR